MSVSAPSPTSSPSGGRSWSGCAKRGSSPSRMRSRDARRSPRSAAAHEGLAAGAETEDRRRVAGRIAARRGHGRAAFIDLVDRSGRIQLHAREDLLGSESFERLVGLDLGDIVGAEGIVFATKRGELSLRLEGWTLLAKSLRPPPDKYHGLEDVELRYRHRELDLIANPEVRELFAEAGAGGGHDPRVARRAGVPRGRDAGAAASLWRRAGAPLHDPPQRPRPRPLPADRHRALPEAMRDRGHRAGLRAGQGLSQRGHLAEAQPRVHDGRVVRGVRRLHRRRRAARAAGRRRLPSASWARPGSSATERRSTWRRPGAG